MSLIVSGVNKFSSTRRARFPPNLEDEIKDINAGSSKVNVCKLL